ncbi:acyl-ACP desaturase [Nocardia implantans]|uniref:Acyl-ACP desaturase n=1 Tax=Nocardia implantans TaxID=3108168 RepID=A0ABU6ARF8_9NOCA|nr:MULTISPECIES: acyl-ACP desaturase [unclassified Nocardia]MBF6191500.1 acyl-ACP desaturase [Nocardia beijingensis]MEA3528193.1 acyl-ACP desaturase [Nocardia sp. CDC192]MEB3510057.1 acyl-ACP desaturase [Nocardia sp. CDC186]
MTTALSDRDILRELEPTAERLLNDHLRKAKSWNPHDYVPWDDGRNFAALGGIDWEPGQSTLSEVAQTAMITNLLTEDNLPSYHREISDSFSLDGVWGTWVGRWTAEENRHAIVMRDYLVVTRAVDPVLLEQARMAHMTTGFATPHTEQQFLHSVAYVTLQELATRISHRNTGTACEEPIAERMLQRVAADENLHMIFYRNISAAAIDLVPNEALRAITTVVTRFQMPGLGQPNFRRNAVLLAKHGIYDLPQHLHVVLRPVLRAWRVFERDDLTGDGERAREELHAYLEDLEMRARRFEEQRERAAVRQAERAAAAG